MEDIVLKPKKENIFDKIKKLFENKKRRGLYVVLFILPFLIAIGIFGYIAFRETMSIIDLLKGETTVKKENVVESMNYVLRDNATDIQKQYFSELKQAIEVDNASDEVIAGLICKNYVADFYTWTNKQGQYDISALYYVYTPQKNDIYLQARDGFYKYLNNYINDYGNKNLIEVAGVTVANTEYVGGEYTTAAGETFNDMWLVTCNWSYVSGSKLDTSKYANKMDFLVVIRYGRYEIVEVSSTPIEINESVDTNVEE